VANYNVDIEVAVKGQAKVKSLQRELTALQKAVNELRKPIDATPGATKRKQELQLAKDLLSVEKAIKRERSARTAELARQARLIALQRKEEDRLAAQRQRGLTQYNPFPNVAAGVSMGIGPEPDIRKLQRRAEIFDRIAKNRAQNLEREKAFKKLALESGRAIAQNVGEQKAELRVIEQKSDAQRKLNRLFQDANKIRASYSEERMMRRQQRNQRIGGALSSGLIGGGFPLLFGQGGASAVGGALGGVAGGAIGGGFGFALSIIGTALGQVIEKNKQFRDSLEEVNRSFSNTGNGAKLFREDIDQLAKSLGVTKEEALEVAQAFAFLGSPELTGQAGKIFGQDKALFQAIAGIKDQATFAQALEQSLGRLTVPEVERLRTELATASALERQIALTDALNRKAGKQVVTSEFQRRRQARVPGFKAETTLVPAAPEAIGQAGIFAGISPLMEALERMRAKPTKPTQAETGESIERSLKRQLARYEEIEPFARKTAIVNAEHLITLERIAKVKDVTKRTQLEELAGAVQQARLNDIEAQKIEQRGRDALDLLREQKRLRKEVFEAQQEQLKKAQQLAKGLSDTIRDGFVDGIKAATDETRTLADALANMLNRLSDQLLNIAANMAFYGNAQGNLSQGQGIIGSLLGAVVPSLFNVTSTAGPGGYTIPDAAVPKFRANGGAVGAGRPYIVGERGPELFVPGAQGNVVSNGAMGGASVIVNVDASGTEVQGNQGGAEQLGRLIGAAVQAELIKQKRPGGLLTR
tara:strand:+ start:1849 stop:4122 length:2274 start_codon:yes stop_codon:yes gene_type:complete